MKTKYIIGSIIAVAFLVVGFISLDSSKIEYSSLAHARESGKRMQVKGVWVKGEDAHYDTHANVFTFTMEDAQKSRIKVIYDGPRPNNFELAESIVVKGKVENNVMRADDILTKCPSKYQGNAQQLQESGMK